MDVTSFILGLKKGIASAKVETQEKTVDVTENGTTEVLPDAGYALSKVIANVNVESSGGGDALPAGIYWQQADWLVPMQQPCVHFYFNGELYLFLHPKGTSYSTCRIYKFADGKYTQVVEFDYYGTQMHLVCVEMKGKVHFLSTYYHSVFDGSTVTKLTNCKELMGRAAWTYNDELYLEYYGDSKIYKWDETADSWSEVTINNKPSNLLASFWYNGNLYFPSSTTMYQLTDAGFVAIATFDNSIGTSFLWCVCGDYYYAFYGSTTVYKIDLRDMTKTDITYRTPQMGSYSRLYCYDGKIHWHGGTNTYRQDWVMYEVVATE